MYEKLTLAGFNAQLKPAYEAAGMTVSDVKIEHKDERGEKVTVISYSAVMGGQSFKQTAYAITLGARTYSVTVTEFTPDAELAAAVLDTISAVKPGENNTTSGTSAAETVPNGCAKHDYNDWEEVKAPTCGEKGEKRCVCQLCGYVLSVSVPKLKEHSFADPGKCLVCGVKMDEDFIFYLNEDGASYTFGYKGFDDTTVSVPATYNGLPVTKIGEAAFFLCDDLVTVNLPSTIVEIGVEAFKGCTSLKNFSIPQSVRVIGKRAFDFCFMLTLVNIPEGVERIENGAFGYSGVRTLVLPKSLKYIGDEAFAGCEDLKSLVLPDGVEEIGEEAFYSCESLTSVKIPSSVKIIGERAFRYAEKLAGITFGGTEDEWNAISFGEEWDADCPKYTIIFEK
jgi:hypothetical protein